MAQSTPVSTFEFLASTIVCVVSSTIWRDLPNDDGLNESDSSSMHPPMMLTCAQRIVDGFKY